jgi:RES domain-containing protein
MPDRLRLFVWRLVRDKYRDQALDGVGSALTAGRWNSLGTRMVYTASTLALAILEIRVHLPLATYQPSQRYSGIELELQDGSTETVIDLPKSWRKIPRSSESITWCRTFGDRWIKEQRSVALKVPSAVVPQEMLFLLNPGHAEFSTAVQTVAIHSVFLDPRLWDS